MIGLRHLALRVGDVDRAVRFYTEVLGMRIDWQPDPDNVYLTTGSDNLALHRSDEPLAGNRLDHFGFMVATPGEVDSWAERLRAAGVDLLQNPKTHRDGSRSIYFHDPDKNIVQLMFHPHIF